MSRLPVPDPGASRAPSAAAFLLAVLAVLPFAPVPAGAGPTIGFIESFPGTSLGGWTGGSVHSNPGTGGVGGAGDGYLHIANQAVTLRLGTMCPEPDYIGDYLAAGADRIRFSLRDVGANQNPEIHFSIGNQSNFWQCVIAFIPPDGSWSEFTVDLNDSANFTQIISFDGFGYRRALATADRVHIRHDTPPFAQTPDGLSGEIGIDDFKIQSTTIGVDPRPRGVARPVMLAPPAPNPSRGGAVFAFEAFDEGPVSLAIVDARGRILRRATVVGAAPGRRAWSWDGLDDAGRSVAAGVYRVRAVSAVGGGTSRSFVRL